MAEQLAGDEIGTRLAALNADGADWENKGDRIARSFSFPDFVTAFGFMAEIALVAERMNHHPEWFNVYGTVKVELSTHDAGGITELDFELALAMNKSASRRSR
jgi:4a-hydroxytetrahydrobiopterin dehydratase